VTTSESPLLYVFFLLFGVVLPKQIHPPTSHPAEKSVDSYVLLTIGLDEGFWELERKHAVVLNGEIGPAYGLYG
jgi:hypothetical protein